MASMDPKDVALSKMQINNTANCPKCKSFIERNT